MDLLFNETTGNVGMTTSINVCPMRVAIMSEYGAMQTLWLPLHMEGKYRFNGGKGEDLSFIYIEADGGMWCAYCNKDSFFSQRDVNIGRSAYLTDRSLLEINAQGKKYILYTEAENNESNTFHAYYIEKQTEITIGRSTSCDICYPNTLVSRHHAKLQWRSGSWFIVDESTVDHATNGTYLNGRLVKESVLTIGDIVYIMGLRIAIGEGFIAMNDGNNRVKITSPRVRFISTTADVEYSPIKVDRPGDTMFLRKPRRKSNIDTSPIEIEMPPMSLTGNKIPLFLRMGSPMVMGSRAMLSGNIAMMLTSMVFPFLTNGYSEKDRKEYEARRTAKYEEYLLQKKEEILQEQKHEQMVLAESYPSFQTALLLSNKRERLWERRKTDNDFLSLRIGSGKIPIQRELSYQPRKFEMEPDPLEDRMYRLVEQPYYLENAPIMISLTEDFLCGINGTDDARIKLINILILRIAIFHSYDEVKIVLLGDDNALSQLSFARYLPHCWDAERTIRLIASSNADVCKLGEHLNYIFADEFSRPQKLKEVLKKRPYYVVIALSKTLFDGLEVLKDVLQLEESCGISIIAAYDGIPIECTKLIELNSVAGGYIVDLKHPDVSDQYFDIDAFDYKNAITSARNISGIKLKYSAQSFELPKTLTFLEMFEAGRVEHLNPLKRWEDNDPVKSLATPIGIGTDGELFYLDLHEKSQGPHGLVAGMTGSGKSEFIITYILSMAVNYNPDEVAFILIDYKGGGLTGAFEDERRGIHLPHLVGTITNLDGAAIQRSLMSINSELKRRQALFNDAKSSANEGTMDIYTYQKLYREKKVNEPLPHLFIISDEFAELKKQQPEFMDELISTARIGRSLGVHLILATQKPSGVVNDQIWSNTKFRICLRVQDKADSMDMLKRPEAAELKDTGRFYLQVGYNEYFALGQSAWCGAGYDPQDDVVIEADDSVEFINLTGQVLSEVKPVVNRTKTNTKQIVAIVKYLSDLAKRENMMPKNLWLPPLAAQLDLDELQAQHFERPESRVSVLVGMVDDPESQRQFPLIIDLQACRNMLIVGSGGSGKTMLIRTMLYSLIKYYTPDEVNIYIMDFSGGALSPFHNTPHCGAYLTETNENDMGRFLSLISGMVAERKRLFTDADVNSYDAYCQIAPLPMVFWVIDNFSGLSSLKNGNTYFSNFHEYVREGASYGIKVIASCNHLNELSSRGKQELSERIALHAKDKYEYLDILNHKCSFVPADISGRGMCIYSGNALEFQVAIPGINLSAQEQTNYIKRKITEYSQQYRSNKMAKKLAIINPEETYADFCADISLERIPLGYSMAEVKKVAIPFKQLYCMSIYFGNPVGVVPVLQNILFAAQRDNMELLIVKKCRNSIFNQMAISNFPVSYYESTAEDSVTLWRKLADEIGNRKIFRNEYCEAHGLTIQDVNTMDQASGYIRQKTKPLLVIFESYFDFCKTSDDSCLEIFPTIFQQGKGYNFYFLGCFYPDDGDLSTEILAKEFNPEEFLMFFGGNFNLQKLDDLPAEYRNVNKPASNYNVGLMKYRGSYHAIHMPCGTIQVGVKDPDDADII